MLFKFAKQGNKIPFVSTANEALAGALMTIGNDNDIFPIWNGLLSSKNQSAMRHAIGLFRYIKIQLEREVLKTITKESGWYANVFHIHSNVFVLFLSSLPHYQAENSLSKFTTLESVLAVCYGSSKMELV